MAKQTNANEVMNERLHSPGMTPGRGSVSQAEAYEVLKKRAFASAGRDIYLAILI